MVKNKKEKDKKVENIWKEIISNPTPIDNIIQENKKLAELPEQKPQEDNLKDNFFAGMASGYATTPTGLAGLGEQYMRTFDALTTAALHDDVTVKDALVKSLIDNKMFEVTGQIDDAVRRKISGKTFEELTPNEQMASITGELVPLFASYGSTGLIKAGDLLRRAAIRSIKKQAVKTGKALTSDAIKKATNRADFAANMVLPGLQVTKNAPKAQQLAEIGVQTAIPVGINELTRAGLQQKGIIGDYSPKEPQNITLINDKRKIGKKKYVEELPEGAISTYTLDDVKNEEEDKYNSIKKAGLITAGLFGSIYATRQLKRLTNAEVAKSVTDKSQLLSKMSTFDKYNSQISDRFAFKDTAVDEGLLKLETANELSRDTRSFINSSFNTGELGDGISLEFSPQSTYNKIKTLKVINPKEYDQLEQFIELNSKIQDEVNRYNVYRGGKNLSPDEYIQQVINNKIDNKYTGIYSTSADLAQDMNTMNELRKNINRNPQLKQIMDEVSNIGQGLLKKMEKSGQFNAADIEYLKKNRTINDLFIYKPRIANTDTTIRQRLQNYLLEDTPYNKSGKADIDMRGERNITNAKNYLDVFEQNYKRTLLDIHENSIKAKTIEDITNGSFAKVNKVLDDYDNAIQQASENTLNTGKKANLDKINKDFEKQISDLFYARPLGSIRKSLDGSFELFEPRSLFTLLNRPKKEQSTLYNKLDTMFSEKKGDILKNIESYRNSKDIISYEKNGREYFYKVDPLIKSAFDLNAELPTLFAESMKSFKNLYQSTVTGKFNPIFSIPSSLMSTHEALTVLPKILDKLKVKDDVSRLQYLREFGKSYKEILTNDVINQIIKRYDREIIKTAGKMDTALGKFLTKLNVENLRANLKKSLLTEIHQAGGGSAKLYTTNDNSSFYTLTKNTKLSEATEKFLTNHYGVDGAVQVIKLFNYMQQALRESPNLSLIKYIGKKSGAIVDDKVVDQQKLANVIRVINDNTANIGKHGTGKGFVGSLAQTISNYVPYGDIMFKSVASKVKASGLDKGIENIAKFASDLYDPKVRLIDVLSKGWKHTKELLDNKYFEGLIATSIIPSIISYVWNYGSQQNMNDYHAISDYDKSSKFILTNILGKGSHLIIPKDQEVALVDSLVTALLDNILGMSRYNEVDPAFKQSKLIMQSLSRSLGIDSIPILDILVNKSGYDVSFNPFDDKDFITPLSKNIINSDLSETAYENGLTNQETAKIINSISGVIGSALLASFEEYNVGKQNSTGLQDFGSSMYDKLTKHGRLLTSTKAISSFNETSKNVYDKRNLLTKIASVSNKSPKQNEIYSFVKTYKRNRIDPIHDKITELRKNINTVRSTGRMPNGSVLDYDGRRAEISNINKDLQKYFAREYQEFKNLDNLLEQLYGKDTILENFMEKYNGS